MEHFPNLAISSSAKSCTVNEHLHVERGETLRQGQLHDYVYKLESCEPWQRYKGRLTTTLSGVNIVIHTTNGPHIPASYSKPTANMKYSFFCTAALASLVSSTAIEFTKRDSSLQVELTPVGNSKVKASVTNVGSQGYNLLYKGSFLDEAPVDKLTVSSAANKAEFKGVLLRMKTTDLGEESFLAIKPGQTIESEIDIAELYDVESTNTYVIQVSVECLYMLWIKRSIDV